MTASSHLPSEGAELLWRPPADVMQRTRLGRYVTWLEARDGSHFDDYESLWRWSVSDLEGFWSSIWDYFQIIGHTQPQKILESRAMPGAKWFPGARLNYAEHALRGDPDEIVILARSQSREPLELSRAELRAQVASAREGLRRLGVGPGDRVAAYLPSIPEAVVAFLATASLGAIWSACAPEFGTKSVLDRFGQIEPKVLLVIGGYWYGAKLVDRSQEIEEIRSQLPSLQATIEIPYLESDQQRLAGVLRWEELIEQEAPLELLAVDFDHPLWILFSSGTTGLPKPIVHGHGGIVLEHHKGIALHHDLGPGDRFFFFSTTGWMVWNLVVSSLMVGASIVLYDGDPTYPDLLTLWSVAAETRTTHFGASASFLTLCRRRGVSPKAALDLSSLRLLVSSGSPLPPDGYRWAHREFGPSVFLTAGSGGTDVCSGFVGVVPVLPVYAGEMSGRWLGADVHAFDAEGNAVIDELGELVVKQPIPSMPLCFWNDRGGERYKSSYFTTYPGVWRHGDRLMITSRGTCVITGRSDATLNRGGVRLGTGEFYEVVESMPEIDDSLVVHLEDSDGGLGTLILFVALSEGASLDQSLRARIASHLRTRLSPRHVPDETIEVPTIPRNLTQKKLEVPVKRILLGATAETVASPGSLIDPASLDPFIELARERGTASNLTIEEVDDAATRP